MADQAARRFWDELAEKDAFHAVDNRLEFGNPDVERFWTEGRKDVDTLLATAGVQVEPADAVVEIGCGLGRMTRVLAERAASVRALDVSERMLELAREYNPSVENVEWILGDGTSLAGIGDESADAVVSHVVFQHIPDPQITLGYVREIGRVLRPGGWAAFQISNDPGLHRRRASRLRALIGRRPWNDQPHWRGAHVELADLRAAAADGSTEVEQVTGEGTQFCIVRVRKK